MAIYLDSNVFIFAAISDDERGKNAREILRKTILGEPATTNTLALDEILWILMHKIDRKTAMEEIQRIMQFDNLRIKDLTTQVMRNAMELMTKHPALKPRDAIHLATMQEEGITTIASDDSDFDQIKEIKRIKLNYSEGS